MNVKGAAFLAREALMIASQGAPRWQDYLTAYAEREPFFRQLITDRTLIPAEVFLAFNEDLIQRFFGGDQRAYWTFGERSAQYTLAQGPLKGLFRPGDLQVWLEYTPQLFQSYFDAGRVEVRNATETTAEIWIGEVPIPHVYFEYTLGGFTEGGLKAVGARSPSPERLRGFSRGDSDVLYRFHLEQ